MAIEEFKKMREVKEACHLKCRTDNHLQALWIQLATHKLQSCRNGNLDGSEMNPNSYGEINFMA